MVYHYRLVHWTFALLLVQTCFHASVAKRFPGKDEYETIENTRKIVKRIEECAVDAREATEELEELPRIETKDDVICGEHTFMHITKIQRNKLSNSNVQRKALSSCFKAIQQHNSFIDIADYIEQQVRTTGGNWLCVVGRKGHFDSNHETKLSDYLFFSISHISVQLLKLPEGGGDTGGGSAPSPVCAASCDVSLSTSAKMKVKRSSMSTEQKTDTLNYIRNAIQEYASSADGIQYVCPYVTNELAINYGSHKWACVAGMPSAFQFTHSVDKGSQMVVQVDKLQVEVVQLPNGASSGSANSQPPLVCPPVQPSRPNPTSKPVRTLLNQYDVILTARSQLDATYVQINETRMSGQMQGKVLGIVFEAIASEGTYDGIAKKIRDSAAFMFGNYWASTVGTDTQYWTYFYMSEPYFINLKIDKLRILLYRQIMYRSA